MPNSLTPAVAEPFAVSGTSIVTNLVIAYKPIVAVLYESSFQRSWPRALSGFVISPYSFTYYSFNL